MDRPRLREIINHINKVAEMKGQRKQCHRCKKVKAFSKFSTNKESPDGRHTCCKECHKYLYGYSIGLVGTKTAREERIAKMKSGHRHIIFGDYEDAPV